MTAPVISVVMSVYNGEAFLREAIESILEQTFSDFEFIIIDDASKDGSREIILSYKDSRIVFVQNEGNLGLTKSLNIGIRRARGKYIARMDADDISLPQRFERQLEFMDAHPDCAACGTWYSVVDSALKFQYKVEHRTDPEGINTALFFYNPIAHPTVIFRKEAVLNAEGYNEDFRRSQDYELWIRLSLMGYKMSNLSEILLLYRMSSGNITTTDLESQHRYAVAAAVKYWRGRISRHLPARGIEAFRNGLAGFISPGLFDLVLIGLLLRMLKAFLRNEAMMHSLEIYDAQVSHFMFLTNQKLQLRPKFVRQFSRVVMRLSE